MWRRAAVVAALAGCGGGGASPVEKCDDLVDVICDRVVECVPAAGTHTECVQVVQGEIPCGTAKDVASSYDRCMDQLSTYTCGVLFPPDPQTGDPTLRLPADCMGVVLTRTSPPGPEVSSGAAGLRAAP